MKIIRERSRGWDVIRNLEQLKTLLTDKLASTSFYMKRTQPPAEFNPGGPTHNGFCFYYAEQVDLKSPVILYTTLRRQLEIEFDVVETPESGTVILMPTVGRIAKMDRLYPRLEGIEAIVSASHFQVSKSEVVIDNTRPQVANQIIFNEFEQSLNQEFPGLKIYDYADRTRPDETKLLNKKTVSILVEDTSNPDSYSGRGPEFLDLGKVLREDGTLDQEIRRYQEDHVNSLMVMPLLIETPERPVPIAFMYCVGRGDVRLDLAAHRRWAELSGEIVQRIGDANLLTVPDRQKVMNVSEGGVALRIENPDLRKYAPAQRWITFDLIFRLQAPMRFHGSVTHVQDHGNHLVIGVDLEGRGHSDLRTDVKQRLKNLIQSTMSQIG